MKIILLTKTWVSLIISLFSAITQNPKDKSYWLFVEGTRATSRVALQKQVIGGRCSALLSKGFLLCYMGSRWITEVIRIHPLGATNVFMSICPQEYTGNEKYPPAPLWGHCHIRLCFASSLVIFSHYRRFPRDELWTLAAHYFVFPSADSLISTVKWKKRIL